MKVYPPQNLVHQECSFELQPVLGQLVMSWRWPGKLLSSKMALSEMMNFLVTGL